VNIGGHTVHITRNADIALVNLPPNLPVLQRDDQLAIGVSADIAYRHIAQRLDIAIGRTHRLYAVVIGLDLRAGTRASAVEKRAEETARADNRRAKTVAFGRLRALALDHGERTGVNRRFQGCGCAVKAGKPFGISVQRAARNQVVHQL